jgi:hypothetical protein
MTRSIQCGTKGEPQISPLRSKNISRKGPRNRRSLGFARDDKGKGNGFIESGCWTEAFFGSETTFHGRSPSPLSSRAKPRDLRFRGPFLEMFFDRGKEKAGRTYGP